MIRIPVILCVAILILLGPLGLAPSNAADKKFDPKRAIEYLMEKQRDDGTWLSKRRPSADQSQPYSIATSAIVCMALLDYYDKDPKKLKPVIEKGVEACLTKAEEVVKLTWHWSYSWSQSYSLRLLARLIQHKEFKKKSKKWKKEAGKIVARILRKQRGNGGWGYGSAATSFQTADTLLALLEIRAAGVKVDKKSIKKGIAYIKNLRTKKGYIYAPNRKTKAGWKKVSKKKGLERSVARNVLCEWVLFLCDEVKEKDLTATMQDFLDHRNFLWAVRAYKGGPSLSRADMLTEFGSPYVAFVFYAYQYAGLAMPDIKKSKRKKFISLIRKDLMDNIDSTGIWRHLLQGFRGPNHGFGNPALATANALIALKGLDAKKSSKKKKKFR